MVLSAARRAGAVRGADRRRGGEQAAGGGRGFATQSIGYY